MQYDSIKISQISFSYVADITSEETRTARMSVLSGTLLLAWTVASLTSKYILEYGGHLGIFCSTLGLFFISTLWIGFFLPDSRRSKADNLIETKDSVLKQFSRSFSVTFKPRTGYKRACLAILLGMRCISIFSDDPFEMTYLYSRKKFGWDVPEYAVYRTFLCSSLTLGIRTG